MRHIRDKNSLKRKNKATVILETERYDDMDSAVIIVCTAVLTLLMMTAESMLSTVQFLSISGVLFSLHKLISEL